MRVLALSSKDRYPLMPDAPTVHEFVPGIEFMSWLGLAMPPRTPRAIVERFASEVHRALALPDVEKKLVRGRQCRDTSVAAGIPRSVAREIETLEPGDRGGRDQGGVG